MCYMASGFWFVTLIAEGDMHCHVYLSKVLMPTFCVIFSESMSSFRRTNMVNPKPNSFNKVLENLWVCLGSIS